MIINKRKYSTNAGQGQLNGGLKNQQKFTPDTPKMIEFIQCGCYHRIDEEEPCSRHENDRKSQYKGAGTYENSRGSHS